MLDVLGEHVMGGAGPLRLVPGFFGADEALTDYAPGSAGWAATLIVTGAGVREARAAGGRRGRRAAARHEDCEPRPRTTCRRADGEVPDDATDRDRRHDADA